MNLRNKNGSITIFVLVGLLFMSAFLVISYASNVNRSKIAKEQSEIINSIYQMRAENVNEIYYKVVLKNDDIVPVINNLPNLIITNITTAEESYVTYGELGKEEETYTITIESTNETFNTMTEVVKYADQWLFENKQYEVDVDVKVIAKGNNNLTSESTQTIKFIRGVTVTNETELNTALASTSPSYIQLANDIECSNTISVDGVTHKVDLNNKTVSKTVTNESFTFITLGTNTNLTIIDSSSEKQGEIVARLSETTPGDGINRECTIIGINNSGTLNVESGNIVVDIQGIMEEVSGLIDKGVGVHEVGIAIQNSGILNLKGATVKSNVKVQAVSHLAVQISEANARGVVNTGTINATEGNITANAEALMVMSGIMYGRKWAYAYGIENSGTVNNSENINFSISTTAVNDDTVYDVETDMAEIKEVQN